MVSRLCHQLELSYKPHVSLSDIYKTGWEVFATNPPHRTHMQKRHEKLHQVRWTSFFSAHIKFPPAAVANNESHYHVTCDSVPMFLCVHGGHLCMYSPAYPKSWERSCLCSIARQIQPLDSHAGPGARVRPLSNKQDKSWINSFSMPLLSSDTSRNRSILTSTLHCRIMAL